MKEGAFKTQISRCWNIIKSLDMDAEYVPNPSYPDSPRAFFKGMTYQEIWKSCLQNRFYHFQLSDNSLIYFSYISAELFSLSYYEFPYRAMSYVEFINDIDLTFHDVGDQLIEEYEEYLTTCVIKQSVSPLRYDISFTDYVEGRHPASHMHIGHESNIRIRTARKMGPVAFLLFLLRQHYPTKWLAFIESEGTKSIKRKIRNDLEEIPSKYVSDVDLCEIYFC